MDIYYFLSGGNFWITIIFIITFLFSIYAQMKVNSTYKNYSKVPAENGMTGEALAYDLKSRFGMDYLGVARVPGVLSDHYNPKTKQLGLSQEVAGNHSVAALAIVAHEMGHARQDAENMAFLKFRNSIFPITNIASNAAIPIFLIGLFWGFGPLMSLGIILFSLVSAFYLITLPIEFNASRRGLELLKSGNYLSDNELRGARAVLTAAALTYVAALASSLATLLRLLFLSNRR